MPDYSKSKIYRLVSPSGLTYIGSTCCDLAKRKAEHKKGFNRWKQGNTHYVTSYELFEESVDDVDIVLLENVLCDSKEELHKKEREYIETLDCVNKVVPTRSRKEYYIINKQVVSESSTEYRNKNKQKISDKGKEYRDKNKEVISEKKKEYYDKNKQAIHVRKKEYYDNNKTAMNASMKQYNANNKQRIADNSKEYYERNKQKIIERMKKPVTCECGSTVNYGDLSKHKKTAKHSELLNVQQNI